MALNKVGITLKGLPVVDRTQVDLFALHRAVQKLGGLDAVSETPSGWDELGDKLGYIKLNRPTGAALRRVYSRYLSPLDDFLATKGATVVKPTDPEANPAPVNAGAEASPQKRAADVTDPSPKKVKLESSESSEKPERARDEADAARSSPPRPEEKEKPAPEAAPSPKRVMDSTPKDENVEALFDKRSQSPAPVSPAPPAEKPERPSSSRYGKRVRKRPNRELEEGPQRLTKVEQETMRLNTLDCERCKDGGNEEQMLLCDACDRGFHTYCLGIEKIPEHGFYCPDCEKTDFLDFGYDDGKEYTLPGFKGAADRFRNTYFRLKSNQTVNADDIEKEFWRIVEASEELSVEYGSDCVGSAFPTEGPYADDPWNLAKLPRLGKSAFSNWNGAISGVTAPWLYVGMCFTSFCWHNEDHYCYSINYLWKGSPKKWYGVPGSAALDFERCMMETVPDLFKHDPMLLFHLVTMLSPARLQQYNIPLCRATQNRNEFIVTFPQAYHAGFNSGFNLAEAVNFAPMDWFPVGRDCVSRYRDYHREYIFSHDRLLWVTLQQDRSYGTARSLKGDFEAACKAEREVLSQAKAAGLPIVHWKDDPTAPMREMPCAECKLLLFFHAVTCECSPGKYACFDHRALLCKCGKQQLEVCWTEEDFSRVADLIEVSLKVPQAWLGRVKARLDSRKISMAEIRDFLQEHRQQELPPMPEVGQLHKLQAQARPISKELNRLKLPFVQSKRVKVKLANAPPAAGVDREPPAAPPAEQVPAVSLPEIEAALAAAAEFPMTLFEAEHLSRYVQKIKAWRAKAQALLKAPVRETRSVDNLLNAALKFPLQLEEVQALTEVKQWAPVEHLYSMLFKGRVSQRKFEELLARSTILPPGHPLLPVLDNLEEEGETLIDRAETVLDFGTPEEIEETSNKLLAFKIELSIGKRFATRVAALRELNPPEGPAPYNFEELSKLFPKITANNINITFPELKEAYDEGCAWLERASAVFCRPSSRLPLLDCLLRRLPPLVARGSDPHCWCRRKSQGDMVCCDVCDVWYHAECLPSYNPDASRFLCPRCQLTKRPAAAEVQAVLSSQPNLVTMAVIAELQALLPKAAEAAAQISALLAREQRTRDQIFALWKQVALLEIEVPGWADLTQELNSLDGLSDPPAKPSKRRAAVVPEDSDSDLCFCETKGQPGDIMICCDVCDRWSHGRCVGLAKCEVTEGKWACPRCCFNYRPRITPAAASPPTLREAKFKRPVMPPLEFPEPGAKKNQRKKSPGNPPEEYKPEAAAQEPAQAAEVEMPNPQSEASPVEEEAEAPADRLAPEDPQPAQQALDLNAAAPPPELEEEEKSPAAAGAEVQLEFSATNPRVEVEPTAAVL